MSGDSTQQMVVTFRVKQRLAELYKVVLIKKNITITDDLREHIRKQTEHYEMLTNNLTIEDADFSKINIRIDRKLYTDYKIQMTLNHTTPTADIIRYLLYTVEHNNM